MFRHVRCVLFDLDGTLIDSALDLGLAADEMRVARGLPSLPAAAYRASAGSGARGMVAVAFGLSPQHDEFNIVAVEWEMYRGVNLPYPVPVRMEVPGQ